MKFCEKCGQELLSRVCSFCGQEVKSSQPTAPQSKEPSETKQPEKKKFRWLRSDRPKRYLAEMALVSIVALISFFAIIPGLQGDSQQIELASEDEETMQPEEPAAPSEAQQFDGEFEQPDPALDDDYDPFGNQDSFFEWIGTWNFYQETPYVQAETQCSNGPCVVDNLRITFAPIEEYDLSEISGEIILETDKNTRLDSPVFVISEGQTELTREFVVLQVGDLQNYDGDYYFDFNFYDFFDAITFESDGREYNLGQGSVSAPTPSAQEPDEVEEDQTDFVLNDQECYRTNPVWWIECGVYSIAIDFALPTQAENGPHGYPVGYFDIPSIRSCDDIETIGYDIEGWAATFQAARDAGATQAFISTQHYAKLFELDTNRDGVICSSQAPD